MPWRTVTVMDDRARFVLEAELSHLSFSELCRRHHISRPTGYKWLERYRKEGLSGLHDRAHRPRSCPHATPPAVVERILELRERRGWGSRKLAKVVEREFGRRPSTDTVHRILQRHGLISTRKPKRRRTHPGPPDTSMDRPNVVWTADFKGQFRTLDGQLCYPLTLQDGCSRFILEIHGMERISSAAVRRRFTRVFREYGIPDRIRTDNGQPFASHALGRLSQLSVWWIQLGIRPEQIEPGKPQQNGRHERMHRTLKARTARPPRKNLRAQQRRFDEFRRVYNTERPHEALDLETPASRCAPSTRPFPERRLQLAYPDHFEIRRVSQMGSMRWKNRWVCVSHLLGREDVGLEEIGDGVWAIYYGPVHLGWLDEQDFRIMDVRGKRRRR
jgi:putative transposase